MINATCPSDEELIPLLAGESADESIQSHLQGCSVCRRRLDIFRSDLNALRSVSFLSGEPTVTPGAAPPTPRPARIGKYLVVGTLDSGGQAEVFRAIHPTLDKELAIKLSHRAVGRLSDHRPLLVAEGKLLAKLEHPNLARIYDLDFHDDQPFLAMEYVRGPNLRDYAKDFSPSPKEAAKLVAEVARALGVVHRHGVVHQDVKPQNILIDETGRPRLIDFGMARLRHAWDDSGERTSGGTPAFMAPEQARAEETAIGPRSDIFALGGVLYFLLTGQVPFQATTVTETLTLASRCEFDKSALNKPGIPRGLRDICLKAMAANPVDRYARADDFAEALERFLTRPQRLMRFGGAAVVILLVAGLIGAAAGGLFSPQKTIEQAGSEKTVPTQPAAPAPTPAPLEVLVSRGDKTLDLSTALPLQATDGVRVRGHIPAGHHAILLHYSDKRPGAKKVQVLSFRASTEEGYTRLTFPAKPGHIATLEPDLTGTEVVLLFATENANVFDDPEQLNQFKLRVAARLGVLPPLPPTTKPVWLSASEAKHGRNFGDEAAKPEVAVEDKLDALRKGFPDLKLSVIAGVAYGR